jgi:Ca-activated chloride channel homolog
VTFLWPHLLWLLVTVPVIVAGYVYLLRRKKRTAARYSNLSMLREGMRGTSPLRRHGPPLVFLLALIAMIVATARPAAIVTLPSQY